MNPMQTDCPLRIFMLSVLHAPACRLGDGDCTCPNPYQPEGETHE